MNHDPLPFTRPTLDEESIANVSDLLRSGWLASGPKVQQFEAALSEYLGGRPVRTMTSATAALEIALFAAKIGPGDEVITTPMSWCATANVIVRLGAIPVFVDIDLDSRNLLLDQVEAKIGQRTRAIMPVHLFGQCADMDPILALASARGIPVIEDAAQSMGTRWQGKRIGREGYSAWRCVDSRKRVV